MIIFYSIFNSIFVQLLLLVVLFLGFHVFSVPTLYAPMPFLLASMVVVFLLFLLLSYLCVLILLFFSVIMVSTIRDLVSVFLLMPIMR
ncbi:hypothetical protein EJD97_013748 [Solanum chilense]|uniref:Uncharacterized protein n=1 Tax=Solanum chilense TaxID=4083 RepID=A0A6N2CAL7_SOLCI|nr:hypothetical protein EJD97_013748 [Solanum chilense]